MSSRIRFVCESCKAVMDAPLNHGCQTIACLNCAGPVRIPPPEHAKTTLAQSLSVQSASEVTRIENGFIRFVCPNCHTVMEAGGHRVGSKINCKKCGRWIEIGSPKNARTVPNPALQLRASAPATPSPAPRYFFMHDGQRFGPVSLAQLAEAVGSSQCVIDDLLWKEGTSQWVPARALFAKGTPEHEMLVARLNQLKAEDDVIVEGVEAVEDSATAIATSWNKLPWGADQAAFKRRFPNGSQTGNEGQWWLSGEEEVAFGRNYRDVRYAFNAKGQLFFVLLLSDQPPAVYEALLNPSVAKNNYAARA